MNIATSIEAADFTRDDVHAALQFGKPPWPGLVADLLFMEDIFPVCHPRLLEGENALTDPRALKHHTLLHTVARRDDWKRWLDVAGVDTSEIDTTEGLVFDITTMAVDAAEAGLGVVIAREAQVVEALNTGRLVAPFRRDLLRGEGCYFLTLPERRDEPHIRAFRSWLIEEAGRQPLKD